MAANGNPLMREKENVGEKNVDVITVLDTKKLRKNKKARR